MKKCPNCQKEFPESMRFCQSDGTPLIDAVEAVPPEDPLKTTVVRQEDIASSIPATDPFKTMVASSGIKEDSGDLLQLPEEFDPLKTMVAAPVSAQDKPVLEDLPPAPPKFEAIKEEIQAETPASPFSGFSQPSESLPEPATDHSDDPTVLQPEPPKFSEPELSPPSFGNLSAKDEAEEDLAATMIQNSWESGGTPPMSDPSPYSNDSPFAKPSEKPMASPFDPPQAAFDAPPVDLPQTQFGQTPQSPFEAPKSPFDPPPEAFGQPQEKPFEAPQQSSFDPPKPAYQEPPPIQFGMPPTQFDQTNNPPLGNQLQQQSDWTPPPTPVAGWQDQGLGSNTPFQPPVTKGQNQILAIISLIVGVISLVLLLGFVLVFFFPIVNFGCAAIVLGFGIGAVITGFLARSRAKANPDQYGGAGLALGGIISGGLSILGGGGLIILLIVLNSGWFVPR